jgi:hypothetical protein
MNTYQNQNGKINLEILKLKQMTTPLPKNKEKKLLSKLRSPIHISFIAESILECNEYNAKEILKDYIEDGVIEEVKDNKNFYRTKSNA